jgi:hypothetical protein
MSLPDDRTVHVVPINDLVDHEDSDECVCGPRVDIVISEHGGSDGYVVVHNSLDGRERYETDAPARRRWWNPIDWFR